eukprot:563107-Heterocapsa_arctica.AAC.1
MPLLSISLVRGQTCGLVDMLGVPEIREVLILQLRELVALLVVVLSSEWLRRVRRLRVVLLHDYVVVLQPEVDQADEVERR